MTVTFRPQVKLPIGPLLDAAGVRHSRTGDMHANPNPITALSIAIGKPLATCHRWCRDGIPIYAADEVATRIGLHPASVWGGDAWLAACWEQDRLEERHLAVVA